MAKTFKHLSSKDGMINILVVSENFFIKLSLDVIMICSLTLYNLSAALTTLIALVYVTLRLACSIGCKSTMALPKYLLAAFLGFQLGIYSSCFALQCYRWSANDAPDKAVPASCSTESNNNGCVTIRLEGWNIITRQELLISMGMCDTSGCNTTHICDLATKSVRNFDVKTCNAICCERDLCNAISNSPSPSNEVKVTKKTIRQTENIAITTDYNDKDDDDDDYITSGPMCFVCQEGSDFHTCDVTPNVTRCGLQYNSCFSITGSLSRQPNRAITSTNDLITHRGCGLEAIGCNVTQLCIDTRNKLFVNHGIELKMCKGYCCTGRFCNNFNPTRPANQLDKSSQVSTRSRRTSKRSQPPPMKCYECKPDSFGSMCKKNSTERSCVTGSHGYDGCLTMTSTITNATTGQVIDGGQWKDCAVRDDDCNANSSRCDTLADIMRERGLALKDCLVSCCHGDLCNGYLPTAGPNLTAYALSKAGVTCSPRIAFLMTSFISMIYHWLPGYLF